MKNYSLVLFAVLATQLSFQPIARASEVQSPEAIEKQINVLEQDNNQRLILLKQAETELTQDLTVCRPSCPSSVLHNTFETITVASTTTFAVSGLWTMVEAFKKYGQPDGLAGTSFVLSGIAMSVSDFIVGFTGPDIKEQEIRDLYAKIKDYEADLREANAQIASLKSELGTDKETNQLLEQK